MRALIIAIAIGFFPLVSFNSYADDCNRKAQIHQEKARKIINATANDGYLPRKEERDFVLCMTPEKEDKDAFMESFAYNANWKMLKNEFTSMPISIYGYMDTFKSLPGDDIAANKHVAGGTNATTPIGKQSNGVIDGNWNSTLRTDESYLVFQHLRLAGLMRGSLDDHKYTLHTLVGRFGVTSITGANSPIKGLRGSIAVCFDGISGKVAQKVDSVMDDGNTTTGNIMVGPSGLTTGATAIASTEVGFDDRLYVVCMGFEKQ